MLSTLIGAELRRHAWKAIFGLIILPPSYIALLVERSTAGGRAEAGILTAAFGVLLSMDVVAAERAEGSWDFLRARPVSRWMITASRFFVQLLLMAALIATSLFAASIFLQSGRESFLLRVDRLYWIRETGLPSLFDFLEFAVLPGLLGICAGLLASALAPSEGAALLLGLGGLVVGWILAALLFLFCALLIPFLWSVGGYGAFTLFWQRILIFEIVFAAPLLLGATIAIHRRLRIE